MTKEEKIKYDLIKQKQALRDSIDNFLKGDKFKSVEDGFTEFKKARGELKKGIKYLEDIKFYLSYRDDRHYKKINKILETTFFTTGNSKIKRALTSGDIEKMLGNGKLDKIINKLKIVEVMMSKITKPYEKVKKLYILAEKAASLKNEYNSLIKQRDNLKTTEDYRKYYLRLSSYLPTICDTLEIAVKKMPKPMQPYCEFILKATREMETGAKLVSEYTQMINFKVEESFTMLGGVMSSKKQQAKDSLLFDERKNKRAHKNLNTGEYLDILGY